MKVTTPRLFTFKSPYLIAVVCGVLGIFLGIVSAFQPLILSLAIATVIFVVCFFRYFEQGIIALLILRSSLDIFSSQGIPALFALGVDILMITYVVLTLIVGRKVITDSFFWFFAVWVAFQGFLGVLLPLSGLGLDSFYFSNSVREWVRLFSWLMVYLSVMQLKNSVHPEKLVSLLFWGLVSPLAVASVQVILPPSLLPELLIYGGKNSSSLAFEAGSRINGTLGHPNGFATFLLLFVGLTCWKLNQAQKRWPWILLLMSLVFFIVSTKALFILAMLGIFMAILILPRLSFINLLGGISLLLITMGLYVSTEFGRERISSLADTPLFNLDIDLSNSILMSWTDNNSFNWRIAQWTFLLESWRKSPLFGYGLATSPYLSVLNNYAHNDYVRALVEGGVVGFTAFISFMGVQFSRLIYLLNSSSKNSSQRDLCSILIAILIAILLGMATENIWSHTTLFFYWLTAFAAVGWDWNKPALDNRSVTSHIP